VDAYCLFHEGELYIKGMHISEITGGTSITMILSGKENFSLQTGITEDRSKVKESGNTIVVIKVFINERGLPKLK